MFAVGFALRADAWGAGKQGQILVVPAQVRLTLALLLNLAVVAASFLAESQVWSWRVRMEWVTPGWAMVLAQAFAVGFVAAVAIREGGLAIAQGILAATLLGYAYLYSGASLIDTQRPIQMAYLIVRCVHVGMVAITAMGLGLTLRLLLRQRLVCCGEQLAPTGAQFRVRELLFLISIFALGLTLVNLFFDEQRRGDHWGEVLVRLAGVAPATLPWLWLLTQKSLTPHGLAAVVGITVGLAAIKAFFHHALTDAPLDEILWHAASLAAAYMAGAGVNGLLLRAMGFRWERGQ